MSSKFATYVGVASGQDTEGNVTDVTKMTESSFDKAVKDAREKNDNLKEGEELVDVPEAFVKQTFTKYEAETLAEAQELCPDEAVLLTYFNRGYSLRQEKCISDYITDPKFEPQDGSVDLREECANLPERRTKRKALSTDDMLNHLKSLPKDARDEILREFMNALATDTVEA